MSKTPVWETPAPDLGTARWRAVAAEAVFAEATYDANRASIVAIDEWVVAQERSDEVLEVAAFHRDALVLRCYEYELEMI